MTQESRCQGARATDVVPDYSTAVGIRLEFLPKLKLPPLTLFAFLAESDLAGRLLTFLAGFFPFFATMILSPSPDLVPRTLSLPHREPPPLQETSRVATKALSPGAVHMRDCP